MTEQLRESLSAAMDNEADAFELRRVLDEAKQDSDLREQWYRFALVRDVMREDMQHYQPGLREAIWQTLNETEDADADVSQPLRDVSIDPQKNQRSPWIGRLTGTAVAAVVAVLVMVNGGVFDSEIEPTADYAGVQPALSGSGELAPVMYQQATAIDQQRQQALMLHHIQQRAMNQASLASFVKVATFRSTPPLVPAETSNGQSSPQK
ncbi:MAG: sigma-E factor negative regulatory protein [Pseudomonadaceae bacterium]|nr:sigma-E factor negative regulatory protein [Pseudomonadaceae bacterium]